MKNLVKAACIALLAATGPAALASGLVGTWKLEDAFCTNAAYHFSPDEQAFVDAIHHARDYPWTNDVLTVSDASNGQWKSDFIYDRGLECDVIQPVKLSFPSAGKIHLDFSAGTTQQINPDPANVKISCESKGDAAEDFSLAEGDGYFDLFYAQPDCGEFHLRLRKQ